MADRFANRSRGGGGACDLGRELPRGVGALERQQAGDLGLGEDGVGRHRGAGGERGDRLSAALEAGERGTAEATGGDCGGTARGAVGYALEPGEDLRRVIFGGLVCGQENLPAKVSGLGGAAFFELAGALAW